MIRIYPASAYAGLGAVEGLGAWYDPRDWGEAAWRAITSVYNAATKVPGWVWDGGKWVYGKLTDKCTYVLGPLSFIPGAKAIFKSVFSEVSSRLGPFNTCSPEGQALATVAFSAYATAHGAPPELASLVATFGIATIVECICQRGGIDSINPPSDAPPDGKKISPTVLAVGALAVGVIGFGLLTRR